MNIDASKVSLREGTLAVRFIDDEDGDSKEGEAYAPSEPYETVPYEGCLAQVVAVGPKVSGVKVGSVVITYPYARNSGIKLDDACVISTYDVVGTLK